MIDVIGLGEMVIDFAPVKNDENGYPTIAANPGGAPANFLTPIAKYGISAGFIGKMGNDAFGRLLIDTLKKNNINTDGTVLSDEYFTTLAFVTLDENGDRSFSFARKPGADTQLEKDDIDFTLIDRCKVLHFGSVSLTDEPSRSTSHCVVEYARDKRKIISFDPNLRKPLWKNLDEAESEIRYGLSKSDIVKISENEVDFLYGCDHLEGLDRLMNDYPDIKILYITCGEKGVYYKTRKYNGFVEALNDIKVLDTTGAGDIFNGTCMYKLLSLDKDIESVDKEELELCVRYGCVGAGLSTTRYGGISSVAELSEIEKRL